MSMPNIKHTLLVRQPLCLSTSLLALLVTVAAAANTLPDPKIPDNRTERLETFFQSFGCPTPHHVDEYVITADTYAIDYRLLPAISVLESTCGIYQRQNNRWGWDSARKGFASFKAGLEFIARQLSIGQYYKNKTLAEKVHTYNPDPHYSKQVNKLMRKIDDRLVALTLDVGSSPRPAQKKGTETVALFPALNPAGGVASSSR